MRYENVHIRAQPGRGAKGTESPSLNQVKVKNKVKISDKFDLYA